jgi:multidrug efflux pump subunit AcrA (membrane-fusion protein)
MSTDTAPPPGSLEEHAAILPQDPPPLIARAIAWLIIALFGLGVAAAILVHIPETVRCPFVLVPKDGADPIQAPYQSVVQAVHAVEGQEVAAGAVLFVLRSDEVRERYTRLHTLTEDLQAQADISSKLEAAHAAQLSMNDAELAQAQRELQFRELHAQTSRDLVAKLTQLAAVGGLSQFDLTHAQLALAESEKDDNVAQKEVETVKLDRLRLETDRARQRGEEKSEVQKLALEIDGLKRGLNGVQDDLLSVRAPYHGVVISVAQRNIGNVVQAGAELCQLARTDATPLAHLLVQEEGLPRLAPGERVRLFFDAFPYQRYGTVTGRLDWISPATVAFEGVRSFTAVASLDQHVIKILGQNLPLRVGMKGESRVIVGSRTLFEYAFQPVRQLRENLSQ